MFNVTITDEQLRSSKALFALVDNLRKYASDSVLSSKYPGTEEDVRLYWSNDDIITLQIYRTNRWIMECDYHRNGMISTFKPAGRW